MQKALNTSTFLREIGGIDSHTFAVRVPGRFPTTDSRWALGGYLVGTWWSLAAALHRTISSLAIRQIVDRACTSKRRILSSSSIPRLLLLPSSFSLSFFCFYPYRSLPRPDNPLIFLSLFFFFFFVSLLFIDELRIKKRTCDRPPGFIREDATSDLRAECNRDLCCDQYWPLQKLLIFINEKEKIITTNVIVWKVNLTNYYDYGEFSVDFRSF